MKDAFYFPHDSNAGRDLKILAMRSVYGLEGYGRYWIIIEALRDADGYRCPLGKQTDDAFAMLMQCDSKAAHDFLQCCIDDFHLLSSDGETFWSESLLRRMAKFDQKSTQAKRAAEQMWAQKKREQSVSNADAERTQSVSNAKRSDQIKSKNSISKDAAPKWLQILLDFTPQMEATTTYVSEIETDYSGIDLQAEAKSFVLWWGEGKKALQKPKSAWRNWLNKARERKSLKPVQHGAYPDLVDGKQVPG